MIDRTASLLASFAVAVLALTMTAFVWRVRGLDVQRAPTLGPSAPSCWSAPAQRSPTERECIA